jgi:TPR repeat protein
MRRYIVLVVFGVILAITAARLWLGGIAPWQTVRADSPPSISHLKISGYDDDVVPTPTAQDIATLQQAARAGNPKAQYILGWAYQHGSGVVQDNKQAVKWYQAAVAQDAPWAEVALETMYESGNVNPSVQNSLGAWEVSAEDRGQACALLDKAIQHPGYALAEADMAGRYLNGADHPIRWPNGCVSPARDPILAIAWTTKAVKDGYWPLADSLGGFYEGGENLPTDSLFGEAEGVHRNFDEAIWWYQIAAQHGDTEGKQHLADLCQRKLQVPGSLTQGSVENCQSATQGAR